MAATEKRKKPIPAFGEGFRREGAIGCEGGVANAYGRVHSWTALPYLLRGRGASFRHAKTKFGARCKKPSLAAKEMVQKKESCKV